MPLLELGEQTHVWCPVVSQFLVALAFMPALPTAIVVILSPHFLRAKDLNHSTFVKTKKGRTLRSAPELSALFFSRCPYDFAPAGNCPFVVSSICSFRYTSELMSYVASSNPCPCVIASVGHASTQYPQKMHRE